MGVRLVKYKKFNLADGGNEYFDHNELYNKDLMNQHPIYAITGLQETLNILEDSIEDTNTWLLNVNTQISNILDTINEIQVILSSLNVINKTEDTYTIELGYNTDSKTLKADLKVFYDKDDTNAVQVLADGIYVPKTITKETKTIEWSEENLGETLQEIFDNGIRFSHNSSSWSNLFNPDEANAWYWNDTVQSFMQPLNTSDFTGFVTKNFYDYYTHSVRLRSTDADNDVNGVVIAFVMDENGNPHTLTALCERNGWAGINNWALVYDFCLPDQQIIFRGGNGATGTIPGNIDGSGWGGLGNGILVRVTKFKNIVTAACSNWNEADINEDTTITIDLNNYSWGYLFQGAVRYGYCNVSQANSFFQDIDFFSDNIASTTRWLASVKISSEADNEIIIKDDGIYAPKFKISGAAGNVLMKKTDGYYVNNPISSKSDNALLMVSDGLYVKDQSNYKVVSQSGHGFDVGDFIYYRSNAYKKASAIDDFDANIVGVVSKVVNANSFEYMWGGFFKTTLFDTEHGYLQGMPLYISETNPGKVTQEQPNISKTVGYPVENIGIIISIERGIQYNQEASIGDFKTSANTYNVRSDGFIRVTDEVDFKLSLVSPLLSGLSDVFRNNYISVNEEDGILNFINVNEIYQTQNVQEGLNLFIKAF